MFSLGGFIMDLRNEVLMMSQSFPTFIPYAYYTYLGGVVCSWDSIDLLPTFWQSLVFVINPVFI